MPRHAVQRSRHKAMHSMHSLSTAFATTFLSLLRSWLIHAGGPESSPPALLLKSFLAVFALKRRRARPARRWRLLPPQSIMSWASASDVFRDNWAAGPSREQVSEPSGLAAGRANLRSSAPRGLSTYACAGAGLARIA